MRLNGINSAVYFDLQGEIGQLSLSVVESMTLFEKIS